MKKLLFFIAFTVLVLPLNAQVQDSMSREAKIYTEEADLVYDHVSESYIGKKAYKRKYGKRFFHDVKRLSKVVHDAPEYTQEQFLRAVALYQISIDKNYETIQKLKRKNLKFKRAGATLFATSLAADIISSVVISRKKEVEMTRTFNKAKAYRITQWTCCAGMVTGIALLIRYGSNIRHYDPGFSLANELYIQECGLGVSLTKKF